MTTVAIDARLIGSNKTGDSTHWTGLLHGLAELQPDLRILFLSNAPKPKGIPWFDGFEWHVVPGQSPRWWSWVEFPIAARRLGADVTHVQYNLSPLAKRGITTVHDISFLIGPEWFPARDRLLLTRGVTASVKRAKHVITVSETSRKEMERYLPSVAGKISVVYNACPPWVSPPDPAYKEQVLQRLNIPRPYVLTVGTRWPRKNMELAVEAANRLPANLPHRLVVTGKAGWGEQGLGSRGVATGYVSEEELSALYAGADLYLAPSFHEGFGVPLLEAFRCGCPVLCSAGGALPEVAADAAEVLHSWSPVDWAAKLESLLLDSGKLQGLREKGFRRVRDFSWKESARRLCAIYEEVARA